MFNEFDPRPGCSYGVQGTGENSRLRWNQSGTFQMVGRQFTHQFEDGMTEGER